MLDFKGSLVQHLPLIEFAYNNNYEATIEMPPYEALYGHMVCIRPDVSHAVNIVSPGMVHW